MQIVDYEAAMAKPIAELFYDAVYAIDKSLYSTEQKQAWARRPIDYDFWQQRLVRTRPFVALLGDRVAGFIELELKSESDTAYVNCCYVSPDCQGQGVASALYRHLEHKALHSGVKQLTVDASLVARPVFEKFGFSVLAENQVSRNGVVLTNYAMKKDLV